MPDMPAVSTIDFGDGVERKLQAEMPQVDTELSNTSTNPVQNKVITSKIQTLTNQVDDMNNVLGAKNLLPNIGVGTSTDNGITYSKQSNGSVIANGTATNWAYYNLCSKFTLDAGTYILSGKEVKAGTQIKITNADTEADVIILGGNDTEKQFTLNTKTTLHAMLYVGVNAGTVTNFVFYPMIRLSSITDSTYEPYSMTNQELTSYAKAQSNPNLLDNPWFTVNQRGQSTYSSTWAYCLDRWYNAMATSVAVNNDGTITITGSDDVNSLIRQILEPSLVSFLTGKTVTISALLSNGTLIKQTGVFTNVSWAFVSYNDLTNGIGIDLSNTGTSTQFRIRTISASTITAKAVKLELGSVSTLAQDTTPNYGLELLKCQMSTADSSDTYANRNAGLAWSALTGKPFDDVGYGLKVTSGTLEAKIGSVTLRNYEDTQQGFCQLWVNQQDAGIITGTRFLQLMQVLSTTGDTTYTFTSSLLNAGSVIDVYTSIYGVNPTNIVITNGQCVVTFPKQSSAELMTCRIYIK